jgi:Ca2+-binding RTX toxin-like protein
LDGGTGDDTYQISNVTANAIISDSKGNADKLDFSKATVRVTIDLSKTGGQTVFTPGNTKTLTVKGVENVIGSPQADVITGDKLANTIWGGAGNDTIHGGAGNDSLFGEGGDDLLYGDAGNDVLVGGEGNDSLAGGAGNDTYAFNADVLLGSDTVTELSGGGTDTLDFSSTTTVGVTVDLSKTVPQAVVAGNLVLTLSAGNVIENAIGGALGDVLIGNALANRLEGREGDDMLVGGAGNDTLVGGAGNDTYRFDPSQALGTDTVIELPSGGTDTLDLSSTATVGVTVNLAKKGIQTAVPKKLTLSLSAGNVIENVIGGGGDDVLVGNALDNVLSGGAGNDILLGGAGKDTLVGGPLSGDGRDIFFGGSGEDTLHGGGGDDLLFGGISTFHNEKTGAPDLAALNAIMAEWKSTAHSYPDRVKYLLDGGGLNKKYKLTGKLLSDSATDTMWGEGEQDWFLVHPEDLTSDLAPLETTTTPL